MSKSYCFNIHGYKIPAKYDKNHDRKLQKSEFNIWLTDNNLKYENNIISYKTEVPKCQLAFKENFDGEIGTAYQSSNNGDCWLLSGVNALASTSWGKKIIKDAIKPDENGGVTVTFKDKSLSQNKFYIFPYEIEQARKSGEYTTGDPDMLALELATEKLFDKLLKDGKIYHDPLFDAELGFSSISGAPLKLPQYEHYMIEELLTGEKVTTIYDAGINAFNNNFDKRILKEFSEHKDDYSIQVGFENCSDIFGNRPLKDKFHGNHAYMIKDINYGKDVTLADPYCPDKPFKISFDRFLEEVNTLTVLPNPQKTTNIKNYRIDSYKKSFGLSQKEHYLLIQESRKQYELDLQKQNEERAQREKELKEKEYKRNYEEFLSHALDTWSCKDAQKYKINKNNILKIFQTYDDENMLYNALKNSISTVYYCKHNNDIKNYITKPVVKALADVAQNYNIDKDTIMNFEKICNKYLDSLVCFNRAEKVADEIMKMYKLIQQQQRK